MLILTKRFSFSFAGITFSSIIMQFISLLTSNNQKCHCNCRTQWPEWGGHRRTKRTVQQRITSCSRGISSTMRTLKYSNWRTIASLQISTGSRKELELARRWIQHLPLLHSLHQMVLLPANVFSSSFLLPSSKYFPHFSFRLVLFFLLIFSAKLELYCTFFFL